MIRNLIICHLLVLLWGNAYAAVTVYKNGRIYTVSSNPPLWADSVAIGDDGRFVAVGSSEAEVIAAVSGQSIAATFDLKKQLVLPGFHDVHLHAVEAGINEQLCYVYEETRIRDLARELKSCDNEGRFGGAGWIMGAGIDAGILLETIYSESNSPLPIDVLDDAFPTTPVVILDNLGHAAVVNTEALSRVGLINAGKVPGGEVLRDEETGQAFGIVTENAQQVFRDAAFPNTPANQEIAYLSLLDALDTLNRNGITSVSDAGGFWRQAQTEAWGQAQAEQKLTVRTSNSLYVYPDKSIEEQLPDLRSRYSNDLTSLVRFNQAKIYVDGILSLGTAAVYDPYLQALELPSGEEYGFEYFGLSANLNSVAQTLVDEGFQLFFHTVGDRSVGLALDAIEALTENTSGPHRLTHCYLIDQRDRTRFSQLGVVADFQVTQSSLDSDYIDFLSSDIIGSSRANQLNPAKEIFETGALITLSSDWDADALSPLAKIESVLSRSDDRSFERLEDVIPLLTINGAKSLQQDHLTGSIEVGKAADMIVLNKNIFEIPVEEISTSQVVLTLLQGRVVFDATKDGLDPIESASSFGIFGWIFALVLVIFQTLWNLIT